MKSETDISDTIIAKSDQLNADDILSGPITVTITGVKRCADEQPVAVEISGGWKPWKPCKTMRRVLVAAWGKDATQWIGKAITLMRDPTVKWAGEAVGGIRISAMSHIAKPLQMSLAESRKSKKTVTIAVLKQEAKAAGNPFVDMKAKWIDWRQMNGHTATAEDFRAFIVECSGGNVAPADAFKPKSHTPELLAECLSRIESVNADDVPFQE